MRFLWLSLWCYVWGLGLVLRAQPEPLRLQTGTGLVRVANEALLLVDTTNTLSLEDVRSPQYQRYFAPVGSKGLNFGFTKHSYWLRLDIENLSPSLTGWLLWVEYPVIDEIQYYYEAPDAYGKQRWYQLTLGDHYAFDTRPIRDRFFVIPLNFHNRAPHTFYIRFRTSSSSQFPAYISTEATYYQKRQVREIVYGIFYGIILFAACYHLFLFIGLRDLEYLYFTLAFLFFEIYLASANGHTFQYFWPHSPWLANVAIPLTAGQWVLWATIFTHHFLSLHQYRWWLRWIAYVFMALGLGISVGGLFLPYGMVVSFAASLGLVFIAWLIVAGAFVWLQGQTSALFFIGSWIAHLTGTLFFVMRNLGFLIDGFWVAHGVEIGAVLQALLLAIALSDKYSRMRLEKEILEKQNLAQQQHMTERLEQTVALRTAELQQKQRELALQNEELTQQQDQIIAQRNYISKRNQELAEINQQLQQKEIELRQSMHTAIKIQHALLPYPERSQEILDQHFIIYQPKEEVSGDFYWLHQNAEERLLLIADCTGYGVPAAMMSMLGYAIIDKVVLSMGVTNPQQILQRVDQEIGKALKQTQSGDRSTIDAAAVRLATHQSPAADGAIQVEIAVANIYVYHYEAATGRIHLIEGLDEPLGGRADQTPLPLTLQTRTVRPKDTLYLFTNGLPYRRDLDNEPIGIEVVLQILQQIAPLPIDQQPQALRQAIQQLTHNTLLEDDLLVIGWQMI
ncbi:7TM diverse intracellular signaling domain-containing protein [Eisenibacter elegans]|uniref:7TM diverse intracellular signaling domain-containing protein n=1 Tax=Eisenibacter elegans TaxID=997 RepID=UPI000420CC10|nr:7TM diverse intracellular signaling domain-containing protein [Eisenibacter elegans]